MKYLLFIALLVSAIITAGCVSGGQNSVGTSTVNTSDSISQNLNNEKNVNLEFRSDKYNMFFVHPEGTVVKESILEPSSSEKFYNGRTANRYKLNIINLSTQNTLLEITIDPECLESVDDYISRIKISDEMVESDTITFSNNFTFASIDNEKAVKTVSFTRTTIENKIDQKAYVAMYGKMYQDIKIISTSYFVVHKKIGYWFSINGFTPGNLNENELDSFVTKVHFIK